MTKFEDSLNVEAKEVYSSSKVFAKNSKRSIKDFQSDVKRVHKKTKSLNSWSTAFQGNHASPLVLEIFMDTYTSMQFALFGLYKYADMSLRAALENCLCLAYFSTHQTEFGWWTRGIEWYLSDRTQHPWGEGYSYFDHIEQALKVPGPQSLVPQVRRLYRTLSGSTHSSLLGLQTQASRLSPPVDRIRFRRWVGNVEQSLSLMNSILLITVPHLFARLHAQDKSLIRDAVKDHHLRLIKKLGLA